MPQLQNSQAQSFSSLETLQWQAMENGCDKMFRFQPNTFKYTIGMMGVFRKQGIDLIGFGISSWWVNS